MVVKSLTRKQKRRKKLLTYAGVLFCITLVLVSIYSSVFDITDVEVVGNKHTNSSLVKEDVVRMLGGNRFLILPNNNLFLYPKGKIKKYLLATYPSVEKVDISVGFKKVVTVTIQDRFPLGVWCADECYFYDADGVVFKKSFKYTGPIFTSWERNPKTPVAFLDHVSCQELCTDKTFSEFLGNYQIEKAVISEDEVQFFSANGYYIKAGFDASSTMSMMAKISTQKPEFLNGLEYVDVRFPTKVFYKERGE